MSIAERDHQPRVPPSAPSSSHFSAAGGNGIGNGGGDGDGDEGERQVQLCPYPADPTFDELGYKVLLYVKRCFRGRVLGAAESLAEAETAKVRLGGPWREGGDEDPKGGRKDRRERESSHGIRVLNTNRREARA